jgi:hypothetical protein
VAACALRLAYRAHHAESPLPPPTLPEKVGRILEDHPKLAVGLSLFAALVARRDPGALRNALVAFAPALRGRLP